MIASIQALKPFSNLSFHIPHEFQDDCGKLAFSLGPFLSAERLEKMQKVVQKRSRHILTVFENTHHGHNISAILRSIDTFGFLDLFFIYSNPHMRFRAFDTIDRGASQWLFPKRLTSIKKCAELLKENHYKIALVTLPHFSRTSQNYLSQLPSFACSDCFQDNFYQVIGNQKIALVFGSELVGVSPEWNDYADLYFHVDMWGFTESLNVSVCAGIILHSLRLSLEKQQNHILLTELERKLVLEYWIAKDYGNASQYIANRKPELLPWFEFVRAGKFFAWEENK